MAEPTTATPTRTKEEIEYQNKARKRMEKYWKLPKSLRGGTDAMRAAGKEYLKPEEKEEETAYQARLSRTFLFSAYGDTVNKLVAKPFSEPITIKELPDQLADVELNADARGSTITEFARKIFDSALGNYGLTHVLTELPAQKTNADGTPIERTAGDDISNPLRPYFVEITPEQLEDWEIGTNEEDMPQLQWIKYRVATMERDVDKKEVEVIRYYYYTLTGWECWRKNKDNKYDLESSGNHTFNASGGGGIPLTTYYINRDGDLTGLPALQYLADINLAHYQSMSDQRNLLRYARVPILHLKGFTETEGKKVMTVGGSKAYRSKSTEASMSFVEHSGKALEAGQKDLEALEERMEVLGLQPLMSKVGNVKATGQAISEAKQQSSIKAWLHALEDAIEHMFRHAAIWLSIDLPEDFGVDVYSDFSLGLKASEDIQALIDMRKATPPMISHETFIKEVKRRGVLSDDVDPEEEKTATSEDMNLSTIGKGVPPNAGEIEDDDQEEQEGQE